MSGALSDALVNACRAKPLQLAIIGDASELRYRDIDEQARAVCATLLALRGELTILAISHQSELMRVADVVYRLDRGSLVDEAALSAVT